MLFKKEKSSLSFSGKRVSGLGIATTVMGGIGWIIFAVLSLYSAGKDGQAEGFVGMIGLLDAALAVTGAILSYRALQERDVYYIMPIIGMALNAVLFIVYFSLYFMGLALG